MMTPTKKTIATEAKIKAVRTLFGFLSLLIFYFTDRLHFNSAIDFDHSNNYFTSGGTSNVWNGAGLGTVHSKPSAPSHGFASACLPPRIDGMTTNNMK